MKTTKVITKKRQHKHIKRKDRFKTHIDFGTPRVPLSNQQPQQHHELLSDWEGAS